jgi:hypothetical protein
MSEVREALDRLGAEFSFPEDAFQGVVRRRDRKRRTRRIAASLLAASVAVAAIAAISRAFDRRPVPAVPPADPNDIVAGLGAKLVAIDPATGAQRALFECHLACLSPTWSRDGKELAYVNVLNDFSGAEEIRVLDAANNETTRVALCTVGCDIHELAWSPDGSLLLYRNLRAVFSLPTDGDFTFDGATDGGAGMFVSISIHASFAPDGSRMIFERGGHVFTADPDGSAAIDLGSGNRPHVVARRLTDSVHAPWNAAREPPGRVR